MSVLANQFVLTAMCFLLGSCGKLLPPGTTPATQDIVAPVDRPVAIAVGQVIAIRPPIDGSAWQVDFSDEVLEALTPREEMQAPGAEGWRFRAIAVGDCEVVITQTVHNTSGGSPPSPPKFVFVVRVRPSGPAHGHLTSGAL